MTREEFFNRMVALHTFDASLFCPAGAGMYNLDLYETDGVIFDYPLQQTIVQVYFYGNFEGLVYYLCYYKDDNGRWDNECLEPNELLFDTIFKNILKEYNLNFEIKNNIPTFARRNKIVNDMENKLYNVQINVDACLMLPVVAKNDEEAKTIATNLYCEMSTDEIRKKLCDVDIIDTVYVESYGSVEKEKFNGREWDVLPFRHEPNTPLCGYTEDCYEDDWFVMNTELGELYMNNNTGLMYITDTNKTYISYI